MTYPDILSPQICGKCHQGAHHSTIEEFETSAHREVTEHVASYFTDQNSGLTMLAACGQCHSGEYRVQVMEKGRPPDSIDLRGKTREEMIGVSCVVCHDPHKADRQQRRTRQGIAITPQGIPGSRNRAVCRGPSNGQRSVYPGQS